MQFDINRRTGLTTKGKKDHLLLRIKTIKGFFLPQETRGVLVINKRLSESVDVIPTTIKVFYCSQQQYAKSSLTECVAPVFATV
jgi:hypothetical protein